MRMSMIGSLLNRPLVLLMCLALIVAGCASEDPKPRLKPRSFKSLAIVSPQEFVNYITPETQGNKAVEGAEVGASSAGFGAMAVGALACGPFLYGLCIAGLGLAGMAVGGVGGLAYGFTGISADDVEILDRKLHKLSTSGDIQNILVENLREKLAPEMLAPVEEAEVQALVNISKIEMRHSDKDLYLKVTARFEYARDESTEPQGGYRKIEGRSSRHRLDYWLEADEPMMQAALAECREKIASTMSQLLHEHWEGP